MAMTQVQMNGSDILLQENQKLRAMLDDTRKEKEQAHRLLRKAEGDCKAVQFKLDNLQNEKQRLLGDNRRFMEMYEQEKQEKIRYMMESSEARSSASRSQSEIATIKTRVEAITNENNRLKLQLENANIKHIEAIKEKQNTVNTIKILQAKLEAAEIQKKYNDQRVQQLQAERQRLMEQLTAMTKKYHQKQIGAEAIIRDEEETKQKLLGQFQRKISIKDEEMKEKLEAYINENSLLKQQIIELERMKK